VIGALTVAAVLTFFGVGLQAIANAVRNADGFSVGTPTNVAGDIDFTPASGWIKDPTKSVTGVGVVATKNGWTINVTNAIRLQPDQTVDFYANIFHDSDKAETSNQVSDLEPFATTSGLNGVRWETNGATTSGATFLIVNGAELIQVQASGPPATLASVHDELEAMAKSVAVSATGGAAS
jgi:hypothetical protein